ncbi:MAG: MOSC domain-containing protein [Anaerolineae bacterium]|nr:MOSC domain-containing protein [Anaerolineae bacterium]
MDAVHLALPDLEAGLAELGASPQDNGTVAMIVRRPEFGQRQVLEAAEIDTTQGLIGDNWLTRGSRHTEDGSANPGQQIAIMNSRVIQAIAQDESRWALAGDQLFLDLDLSAENLPPGQRIAVGTAVLEISEIPHNGCGKFTERFGSGATHFVNSKEGRELRRRGVNARVIQSGTVRAGDTVKKITT